MRGRLSQQKPKNLNIQKKDLGQFVDKITQNSSHQDWSAKNIKEENKQFYTENQTSTFNNLSAYNDNQNNIYRQNNFINNYYYEQFNNSDNQNWYELRIIGKQPERRAYHTTFMVGKKMYIYGGHDIKEGSINSFWMLDLSKLNDFYNNQQDISGTQINKNTNDKTQKNYISWVKIETFGKDYPGRIAHHTSVMYGDKLYVYGGTSSANQRNNLQSFFSLDLKTYKWDVINARGEVPSTRDDHTAVYYEASMVIFGGFSSNGERSNDVYRYYFKDNSWDKVSALGLDAPEPRAGHSALVFGDSMVIFGGRDIDSNKLNDIWIFNFSTYQWECIDISEDELKPYPRSGHTACLYKDMMLVFGGMHEVTKELDDMMLFDFRNKRWIQFFEELQSPVRFKRLMSSDSPTLNNTSQNNNSSFQNTSIINRYNNISSPNKNRLQQKRKSNGSPSHLSISKQQSTNNSKYQSTLNTNNSKSLMRQTTYNTNTTNYSRAHSSYNVNRRKRNNIKAKLQLLLNPDNKNNNNSSNNNIAQKQEQNVQLVSPTSISMQNSFIIKNSDQQLFETYYNNMRKRRNNFNNNIQGYNQNYSNNQQQQLLNQSTLTTNNALYQSTSNYNTISNNNFQQTLLQPPEGPYNKVQGKRPAPRDGHSAVIFGDYYVIFGGDRHQMPFNDLFILDLRKEFIMRSHIFH